MVHFEIKKVFSKTSNKLAVLVLLIILGVVSANAITSVEYVNEDGCHEENFITAIRKLKTLQKEWTGELTEERLRAAIEENIRINATPEATSLEVTKQNIAYAKKQGIEEIRSMINSYYGGFDYSIESYYIMDSLQPEDSANIYSCRVAALKDWLKEMEMADKGRFTDKEREYLIGQYEKMETPLMYDWYTGWDTFSYYAPMLIMIMPLVLGFLVAGIFSNESKCKADAIFYSSYHGRGTAIMAKVAAGFIIVTVFYWLSVLLFSAIVFGFLGTEGAGCMIQVSGSRSYYNITFFQMYLLIIFGGYIASLFVLFLTMFVSAKTKSAAAAVVIPFAVLFLPSFMKSGGISIAEKFLALLPDQLMQIERTIKDFQLFQIGNRVTGSLEVLIPLYMVLTVLLCPAMYRVFKNVQVK